MKKILQTIFILCLLAPLYSFAGEIVDERITLTVGGTVKQVKRVEFAGQPALIEGININNSSGMNLFSATEPILDAVSSNGVDYILMDSTLLVRMGKKSNLIKLSEKFSDGKILFASPTFLIYYLTADGQTTFWTHSLNTRRIIFAADKDFVKAVADKFGNIVVGYQNHLIALDKAGRIVPLLQLEDSRINSLEIDFADNGILIGTSKALLKFAPNRKLYTLVTGSGAVEKISSQFYWNDYATATRFEVRGQNKVGDLENDKFYVRTLISQAEKMQSLGLDEKAFQKYLKILEIMPNEPNIQQIILVLGEKLYGKTTGGEK
jgi:hypothetical protein